MPALVSEEAQEPAMAWQEARTRLGLAIIARCEIHLADEARVHATADIKNSSEADGGL